MKTTLLLRPLAAIILGACGLGTSQAQLFQKTPEKLDAKIQKYTAYLEALQADSSTRIPAAVLARAKGIIILRELKLGLGLGGEAGGGVAMARDPQTGLWSPPAFVASAEGSYGFQIGGQRTDTVMLLMDDLGMQVLRDGGVEFGVNLRATVGPVSGGGEANFDSISEPVLIYASRGGLYAGAVLEGGGIVPAEKANAMYYGFSMAEVLFEHKATMTQSGLNLARKVDEYSRVERAPAAPFSPGPGFTPVVPGR